MCLRAVDSQVVRWRAGGSGGHAPVSSGATKGPDFELSRGERGREQLTQGQGAGPSPGVADEASCAPLTPPVLRTARARSPLHAQAPLPAPRHACGPRSNIDDAARRLVRESHFARRSAARALRKRKDPPPGRRAGKGSALPRRSTGRRRRRSPPRSRCQRRTRSRRTVQMSKVVFSPTRSRAVLGSMNDFSWLLDAHLAPGRSLIDVSVALSHTPCTPDRRRWPAPPLATIG